MKKHEQLDSWLTFRQLMQNFIISYLENKYTGRMVMATSSRHWSL